MTDNEVWDNSRASSMEDAAHFSTSHQQNSIFQGEMYEFDTLKRASKTNYKNSVKGTQRYLKGAHKILTTLVWSLNNVTKEILGS